MDYAVVAVIKLSLVCHFSFAQMRCSGVMSRQTVINIHVEQGVPESHREVAAALYADVFAEKYRALIGEGEQARRIIAQCIVLSQAFAAFDGERLVGVAGFHRESAHFLRLRLAVLVQEFGTMAGFWRFFLYLCQRKRVPRRDLLMDGLVVAADYRSKGVGSLLIQRLVEYGRRLGFTGLRLSVVDTNPRAQMLYERLGFRVLQTRQYHHLEGWIPFTVLTIMRKPLRPAALPVYRSILRPVRRLIRTPLING